MKYRNLLAVLAFALMSSINAHASNLDSPINTKPTVGSEIKRGIDAAFTCSLSRGDIQFNKCISSSSTSNKQNIVEFEPFLLGLHFVTWVEANRRLNFFEKHPQSEHHFDLLKLIAEGSYYKFTNLATKYTISPDELITLSRMNREIIEKMFTNYPKVEKPQY